MKQSIIDGLVILSVLTTGAGLAWPGLVKWRSQMALSGLDGAILTIAAMVFAWGAVCGARFAFQSFNRKGRPSC